jgi:predicted transcriptional regulator
VGEIRLDDLPPGTADRVRDAMALVKTWTDRDEEGARAIFAALEDEGGRALEDVTRHLAALFGMTLRTMGIRPEDFTGFSTREDGRPG